MITIHPLTTHAEMHAVEQLQVEVWGVPDVEVVPLHVLITAARNGGLLLGAFDGQRLAGFVFGFPGLAPDGRLKHCSHMAGVHPDYRDHGLGYRLKLAQREHVLAQGIDLITWTFDPLETRNATLNFHKLGALCRTYLRDLYGSMRDSLNVGLPSDRFQVEWWVASQRVVERLQPGSVPTSASPYAVSIRCDIRGLPSTSPTPLPSGAAQVLVEIPANFQIIKATDMPQAVHWRFHTRQLFEDAFAAGYQVTDLYHQANRCHYLLERI
jgi:chorismate synthase